jgi:hypothetical protein
MNMKSTIRRSYLGETVSVCRDIVDAKNDLRTSFVIGRP